MTAKRSSRAPSGSGAESPAPPAGPAPPPDDLPDVYRPGDWITATQPRKAPYQPQMGDQCLYFRLVSVTPTPRQCHTDTTPTYIVTLYVQGHQRYFEAVAEKDVYKVNPRDKPWERTHVYVSRVGGLGGEGGGTSRSL